MAEIKEYTTKADESGKVIISEEVIASIAGIAASEIDGVASLGTANVADFLAKKANVKGVKGVKVVINEDAVEIFATITVKKGVVIPTVAKAVQANIISSVESMTGIKVAAANVKVGGVFFEKEAKKAAKSKAEEEA